MLRYQQLFVIVQSNSRLIHTILVMEVVFVSRLGATWRSTNLMNFPMKKLQATWIEFLLPKTKPIVCGVVYRPPQQNNFYELSVCLTSSYFMDREYYVLGDFNTNVSTKQGCNLLKSLTPFLVLYNLSQIIKDSTHVSAKASSTIDLILVSDTDKVSQSGVIDFGISEHCFILCTRKGIKTFLISIIR